MWIFLKGRLYSRTSVSVALSCLLCACSRTGKEISRPQRQEVFKISEQPLKFTLDVSGEVRSSSQTVVRAQTGGTIEKLLVKEGDIVELGAPICIVQSRRKETESKKILQDVRIAQLELDKAKAKATKESTDVAASIDVNISEEKLKKVDVEQAELAYDIEQLTVRAPFRGKVVSLEVKIGDLVSGSNAFTIGSAVAQLVPDAEFAIDTNVGEREFANLSMGQVVRVRLAAFEGRVLEGKISRMGQVASENQSRARVFPITVTFSAQDIPVRIGMSASLAIPIVRSRNVLMVPVEAVESDDSGVYVLRRSVEGLERRAVILGLATAAQVELVSGVESGDQIVYSHE